MSTPPPFSFPVEFWRSDSYGGQTEETLEVRQRERCDQFRQATHFVRYVGLCAEELPSGWQYMVGTSRNGAILGCSTPRVDFAAAQVQVVFFLFASSWILALRASGTDVVFV